MSSQRPRAAPSGVSNGSIQTHSRPPQGDSRGDGDGVSNMTRAQRFEDEKRRLIESCFSRRDEDGAYSESYITHIRITEDAASPSAPPPPNSGPENKKARVIVVAVKKTGRVRMHKAKENVNGTFSIGKTWSLDDLSAIESFTRPSGDTFEDKQRQRWAGDSGVVVTIQKPYFWQTATSKEKDFFIGSLIKIYQKYTGGKLPQLTGFSDEELATFTTPATQRPRTPQTPSSRQSPAPQQVPPPPVPYREPNRELRPQLSRNTSSRRTESEDRGRSIPGQFPQSEFVRNLRPQESKSRFQELRSESPTMSSLRSNNSAPPSPSGERSQSSLSGGGSAESFANRQLSRDGPLTGSRPSFERLRSNGRYSPLDRAETPPQPPLPAPKSPERGLPAALRPGKPPTPQPPKPEQLPERKRPPISVQTQGQKGPGPGPESPQEFSTPSETSPPAIANDKPRQNIIEALGGLGKSSSDTYISGRMQGQPDAEDSTTLADLASTEEDTPKTSAIPSVSAALSQISSPTTPASVPESPAAEEVHRPGLGPMIKKKSAKDIANVFRKAALAHNAFKPRSGGAAERIREEIAKTPNTPDGINGVFPAPSLLRDVAQDNLKSPAPNSVATSRSLTPDPSKAIPNVTITPSPGAATSTPESPITGINSTSNTPSSKPSVPPEKQTTSMAALQEERRRKRRSNHSAKYAKALGIDHTLLEGRTADFESTLMDFGWGDDNHTKISFEALQSAIKRDLAKVETGSWLQSLEQNDERVGQVSSLIDQALAECDELEGLLTLYNVELGTLSEDVAYIEAQSQGLQVQTANQKLLYTELKNLLETITISSSELQVLKDASLARPAGVEAVEKALTSLYKAMLTIDPKLRQAGARPNSADDSLRIDYNINPDKVGAEVSTMRAVQEKKQRYRDESVGFIQRFKQHMAAKFREAETETSNAIHNNQNANLTKTPSKLDHRRHEKPRAALWIYSPLMLFAREIDMFEWEELLRMYESTAKKPYQDEFKENITAWKRVARTNVGDDQTALFTTQEKESESLVARKLTVKRTKTLREGSRNSSGDKPQDGKINGFEVFAGALSDMSQSIYMEQNFVVDLFHASSLEIVEFPDLVAAVPPEMRKGGNLSERKLFDPDRSMAKRVQNTMEDMYSFWPSEIQNLVDWVIKQDALQGVGVMFAIESKLSELEDTNQEFLIQTLSKVHNRLNTRFDRFIDEQIRGIEDTKVKIKKRKGVIAFMKTFPYFSASIEMMLPIPRADNFEVRHLINDTYTKLNKAMFESLKFIAKESPVVMTGQKSQVAAGGDVEDKEILNYHILLIENMNHYVEEVDVRNNSILKEWKDTATQEMNEHLDLYLGAVIRRPLGKLLDFVESTEALLANGIGSPTSIAARASHSRSTFKKLLSTFDAKEIRRGIDALKKRVEKHFGDADDPGLSRNLVMKVLKECEDRYLGIHDRTKRIVDDVYEGALEIEFKREDVSSAFRR